MVDQNENDIYEENHFKQGAAGVTDSSVLGSGTTVIDATSEVPGVTRVGVGATATVDVQSTTPQTYAPSTTQAVTQPTTTIPDDGTSEPVTPAYYYFVGL
jgi:hypothetical protein